MRKSPAPRVLVLEDGVRIALDIYECLIKAGYQVLPAVGDAIEALKQTAKTPPEIAIVDVDLRGGINGLSAARELAGQYDAQIAFATGFAEDVRRGEHERKHHLIAEPFAEAGHLEALDRLSGPVPDGLSVKADAYGPIATGLSRKCPFFGARPLTVRAAREHLAGVFGPLIGTILNCRLLHYQFDTGIRTCDVALEANMIKIASNR